MDVPTVETPVTETPVMETPVQESVQPAPQVDVPAQNNTTQPM